MVLSIGLYVYVKNKRNLTSKLLLLIAVSFLFWIVSDLILWTSADSRTVMFVWSIVNIFEMFVSMSALYFSYVFLEEKDAAFRYKLIAIGLFIPYLVIIPTRWQLTGFNIDVCEAVQGVGIRYYYFFEALFPLWLLIYFCWKILHAKKNERKQVAIFALAVVAFLASFSGANIVASYTQHWEILYYGLIGVPIFVGLLAYLIVKYRAFDTKLIGVQALVFALVMLIGSQLFFIKTTVNMILTLMTLAIAIGFGYFLIRSVKEEVRRKEELQAMASRLAVANEELRKLDNAKSEFISIASHQLRTPLTAIKGFLSLVLEGSYGKISTEIEDVINKVYTANSHLVVLVEDLLNVSRLESGRMQYQFAVASMERILEELKDAFSVIAMDRGISLSFSLPEKPIPAFFMDAPKIREVVSNLIDNAMKYTKEGSISVKLEADELTVRVIVEDSGVGIAPEDIGKLFQKFRRGTGSSKVNVSGTGLGLYVGKNFAEAHGGRLFAESDGPGQGSRFILEIPLRREEQSSGAVAN
jgi:signal transduction histidine kinase